MAKKPGHFARAEVKIDYDERTIYLLLSFLIPQYLLCSTGLKESLFFHVTVPVFIRKIDSFCNLVSMGYP